MRIGVMYSGVGGANGADYVAEQLANGFRDAGARVTMIGQHGGYFAAKAVADLPAVDAVVHSSGFNLTPDLCGAITRRVPLLLWTHNDEIPWWRDIIAQVSNLVTIHYSYTKAQTYGDHVRLMHIAADPTWYYPERFSYDDSLRTVDVVMVGSRRAYRVALCEGIAKHLHHRRCIWSWAMGLPVAHIRELYSMAKVVIAPVQDCDEDIPARAWGCPCRTFEVRACNVFQAEVERGGLEEAYPAAFTIPALPVEKAIEIWCGVIEECIADVDLRQDQAQRDYDWTLQHHLYRHRAQRMLDDIAKL